MNQPEINLNNYFNMSMESLRLLNFKEAISFIDLAITDTSNKEFYMFQKVKILFITGSLFKCSRYIEKNLVYFYENCSLHIFSQILHYYKQASKKSTDSLYNLLNKKNIPFTLADHYISFFCQEDIELLEKARDAIDQCDYLRCISYCSLMVKQGSQLDTAYYLKGKSYHMLKKHTKAIACFQNALQIEPSNTIYRNLLAEAFYKWRKYDSALINFKKVISQDPLYTEAYLRIADIYHLSNNPRKAKQYYKKVLRIQARQNPKTSKRKILSYI